MAALGGMAWVFAIGTARAKHELQLAKQAPALATASTWTCSQAALKLAAHG